MALNGALPPRVRAVAGFGLNSRDGRRLAGFYEQAFGARVQRRDRGPKRHGAGRSGVPAIVRCTVLDLGESTVELLEFDPPGQPYPHDLSPCDTRFQHLAIVVTDMQSAMHRLSQTPGWAHISTEGPQRLPQNAGGVSAFKFRDPEGHPLEFLQFPAATLPVRWQRCTTRGVCSGIDHSALSVADIDRSVQFYGSLGLRVSSRSLNHGLEQQRLDGTSALQVDVVGLAAAAPTPHVELLHYRMASRPVPTALACNDTAATRLIFLASGETAGQDPLDGLIQDPDGHWIEWAHTAPG